MSELLLEYHKVPPTTWAYLSSLLMIGLFFKFNRFWSVRNLDLLLLILLAPGMLLAVRSAERGLEVAGRLRSAEAELQRLESQLQSSDGVGDVRVGGTERFDRQVLIRQRDTALERVDALDAALVKEQRLELAGYIWLLAVAGLLLVRLLLDATMVRRPLLEPNLSTGGLTFIGCSLFVFLMANVITSQPTEADLQGPRSAELLLSRLDVEESGEQLKRHGPGYALLNVLPSVPTMALMKQESAGQSVPYVATAKTLAIFSHLAIVFGIVAIGYWHFANIKMGIGVATLYLMLPYTAQMTGRLDHVIPAALLVWAVLCYRRPLTSGMFIGLAIGVVYYPLFLLPLWISFYWQRGLMRFASGVLSMLLVMVMTLAFTSSDMSSFWLKFQQMFGIWSPAMEGLKGVWGLGWNPVYRMPILALFVALSGTLAVWPAQKNLGTLLSCSGAVMVATQFWHGFGGGLFMAWYLPLLLLTIFRPNLEDRVALTVLGEAWFPRRHGGVSGSRAA